MRWTPALIVAASASLVACTSNNADRSAPSPSPVPPASAEPSLSVADSPTTTEATSPLAALIGHTLVLQSVDGEPVLSAARPWLKVTSDLTVSGDDGCGLFDLTVTVGQSAMSIVKETGITTCADARVRPGDGPVDLDESDSVRFTGRDGSRLEYGRVYNPEQPYRLDGTWWLDGYRRLEVTAGGQVVVDGCESGTWESVGINQISVELPDEAACTDGTYGPLGRLASDTITVGITLGGEPVLYRAGAVALVLRRAPSPLDIGGITRSGHLLLRTGPCTITLTGAEGGDIEAFEGCADQSSGERSEWSMSVVIDVLSVYVVREAMVWQYDLRPGHVGERLGGVSLNGSSGPVNMAPGVHVWVPNSDPRNFPVLLPAGVDLPSIEGPGPTVDCAPADLGPAYLHDVRVLHDGSTVTIWTSPMGSPDMVFVERCWPDGQHAQDQIASNDVRQLALGDSDLWVLLNSGVLSTRRYPDRPGLAWTGPTAPVDGFEVVGVTSGGQLVAAGECRATIGGPSAITFALFDGCDDLDHVSAIVLHDVLVVTVDGEPNAWMWDVRPGFEGDLIGRCCTDAATVSLVPGAAIRTVRVWPDPRAGDEIAMPSIEAAHHVQFDWSDDQTLLTASVPSFDMVCTIEWEGAEIWVEDYRVLPDGRVAVAISMSLPDHVFFAVKICGDTEALVGLGQDVHWLALGDQSVFTVGFGSNEVRNDPYD